MFIIKTAYSSTILPCLARGRSGELGRVMGGAKSNRIRKPQKFKLKVHLIVLPICNSLLR